MKLTLSIFFIILTQSLYSQNNKITIEAKLYPHTHQLEIQQKIVYYNTSNDTLKKIVLRNWANSYKNDSTPLAKRLLGDYKTDFYFSNKSERGFSEINSIHSSSHNTKFEIPKNLQDLVFVKMNRPLSPGDSIDIDLNYSIKIPDIKFTGSGHKNVDYFLEDWHITPSIYQNNRWLLDTHKNLNYQFKHPTDYTIRFTTPMGYNIYSNFSAAKSNQNSEVTHQLQGKNVTQTNLSIVFLKSYLQTSTHPAKITTNFTSHKVKLPVQQAKMQQMLLFLQENVGTTSQNKILVEKKVYDQNPIYELKYLPKQLHPYSSLFKWEAEFFKALTSQYIDQIIIQNNVEDYWFTRGLETYLLIKYINQYYPDSKILGRLSKIWGVKFMNIAKQDFNAKFSIIHQITARENLDQKLSTPIDKLSNYNKKVVSPYKAGIGFLFLEEYIGTETLKNTIRMYVEQHLDKPSRASDFLKLLNQNTSKNIDWFENEWLKTNKKIDHKIVKTTFKKDSVHITLKNNKSIKTPVLVYGLKNDSIIHKTWFDGFSDVKQIALENSDLDKVVLNYENIYPEINYRNNWDNKKNKLFERPIQIMLLKDLNNPNTNQIFLKPEVEYNFYDGVLLGLSIQNKAYIRQNLEYALKPTYGFKSNSFTGGFKVKYTTYPEQTNIYATSVGISGSNYHYAEDLNYNTLSPFFSIDFKQKDFRALGTNKITAKFLLIDRELEKGILKSDEDEYNLFKLDYLFKKNKLIHNYQLDVNTEIASKFSKLNTEFRYRHLTSNKRPIEFRFFGGFFFSNKTKSDFFSFNQHTANDYLFELPYLGRSEEAGLLSQQYFKAQGGFVSQNEPGFANQWLTSINTSVGIYKWIETFNNVSLLKNRNSSAFFDYEGGIRLNFIPDILEFYLPVYNKEGLVFQEDNYLDKVRFVITLRAQPIVRFLKQQLF
ncbi:M1 family aminopeptidase [Wenyingzhuangia sp. IMCC45533]